jgi:hypothetical protein
LLKALAALPRIGMEQAIVQMAKNLYKTGVGVVLSLDNFCFSVVGVICTDIQA